MDTVDYKRFKKERVQYLYIYCGKCKMTTQDPDKICNASGRPMCKCKDKSKHVYKVKYFLKEIGEQKSINLIGDFKQVKAKAADFVEGLKNPNNKDYSEINEENFTVTYVFTDFICWAEDEGVYEHQLKNLSKAYIKEMTLYMKRFTEVLKENKIDPNVLKIENINAFHIGKFYKSIKHYSPKTYNKYMNQIKYVLNNFNERYDKSINTINLFKNTERTVHPLKVKTLKHNQFESILSKVNKENGCYVKGSNNEKRNLYKEWLLIAFKLALYTGRRREEIINMKWENVYYDEENDYYFFSFFELKVQRIGGAPQSDWQKMEVPIYGQSIDFLMSIGLKEKIGKDEYIIPIEEDLRKYGSIKTIADKITKAFTHYAKQADLKGFTLYDLKRTYLTNLKKYSENDTSTIANERMDTINRHYINHRGTFVRVSRKMTID